MNLRALDISIILIYLLATVVIGFVGKKQASENVNTYFLGGNALPWYMLGLFHAKGMFVRDGSNVMFPNGWVVRKNGDAFICYVSPGTRMHVATSTVEKLTDTPEGKYRSAANSEGWKELISNNLKLMNKLKSR